MGHGRAGAIQQVFKFGHAPPHLSQISLSPQQKNNVCTSGMGVAGSLKNAPMAVDSTCPCCTLIRSLMISVMKKWF